MSDVLVIGAHGKIALLAAPLLVEAGHTVTGVVRNPDHTADVEATGARAVVADVTALDVDGLAELLEGHDTVVFSAGAGGGDPQRTYAVDRDAAVRTTDAAVRTGARLVLVSYFGAGPDHGVDPSSDFFAYADAKAAADEHLAATSIGWTILRPSSLTDDPAGGVQPGADGVEAAHVSRATVAHVIAAVVDAPDAAARTTLAFNDGDQPVEALLRG